MTALQTTKISHCEYADDIALTTNTAQHLQLQLNRFHTFTTLKGLTLNAHKTKTMAFFCSNPLVFRYNDTPLENVQEFKYLGTTLSHNRKMTNASNQMARTFAGAIARVWRICSELSNKNRKHTMLGYSSPCSLCRPIWMSSLGYKYSHIQIFCYNQSPHSPQLLSQDAVGCEKKLLLLCCTFVLHKCTLPTKKDRSATPLLLLVPLCCSLLEQPIDNQHALLSKINEAHLRLAHRKGSWTFEVLSALRKISGADVHVSAIMRRSKIIVSDLEPLLHEQIIQEWRGLYRLHPDDARVSSRIMRTYQTHFGVPIGSQTGWWDDQKRATKPTLPSYL